MKRKDITGKEYKIFGYTLEFVKVNKKLKCIAIWKNNKLIKRFGN